MKMSHDEIKEWMKDNLVMRSEARKITEQSESAFGQALSAKLIKPFIEFGDKRKTILYLVDDLEKYAATKK